MDPGIKRKWVEALRSGKYTQTVGTLRDGYGYCCLGVLAWLQNPGLYGIMPNMEAIHAAGLTGAQCNTLANMNDGRGCDKRSFDHIAGYIDSML